MARKDFLKEAKKNKADEFYTQLCDIEKELQFYKEQFKGKVVLCNCDDPYESNFFKYFILNFNYLGLKRLITTCYSSSPVVGTQISLFDEPTQNNSAHPYKVIIDKVEDLTGNGAIDLDDIQILLKTPGVVQTLEGDGDFRSAECLELLKEADVVVTNPPFSLFREYVSQLMEYNKKFLIIGNINCITYKEIFPLIKNNLVWLGHGMGRWISGFIVPDTYELFGTEARMENDKRIVSTNNCLWLTNLEHNKRHEPLDLFKRYKKHEDEYPHYDNYDAIEVSKTSDIPYDYDGLMGVPITFLDKFCPEQFEIIGCSDNGAVDADYKLPHFKKHNEPYVDGKKAYKRIFIKRKG